MPLFFVFDRDPNRCDEILSSILLDIKHVNYSEEDCKENIVKKLFFGYLQEQNLNTLLETRCLFKRLYYVSEDGEIYSCGLELDYRSSWEDDRWYPSCKRVSEVAVKELKEMGPSSIKMKRE